MTKTAFQIFSHKKIDETQNASKKNKILIKKSGSKVAKIDKRIGYRNKFQILKFIAAIKSSQNVFSSNGADH